MPTDLPVFFRNQRDLEANRAAGSEPRDREAFDAHWAKLMADPTNTILTVTVGDEVAGYVLSFERDAREIAYWLGREHWGHGVATAAVSKFLERVEERPLHGVVAEHNLASLRVLEKCGFVRSDEIVEVDATGRPRTLVVLTLASHQVEASPRGDEPSPSSCH